MKKRVSFYKNQLLGLNQTNSEDQGWLGQKIQENKERNSKEKSLSRYPSFSELDDELAKMINEQDDVVINDISQYSQEGQFLKSAFNTGLTKMSKRPIIEARNNEGSGRMPSNN